MEYCSKTTNDGLLELNVPCSRDISEQKEFTFSATHDSKDPELRNASVLVLFQFMPREVSEEEYLQISKQQIESRYSDVKFKDVSSLNISGYHGRSIEVEYTDNGDRLYSLSAFALGGKAALVFVGVAPVSKAKEMKPVFDKVLSTLTVDTSKKNVAEM
ncbi:MAG: DUF1795 domain-containing protein [Chitinivibrionales bacterium]|nr:DUF1795 domain-containing protein [Chitinivibrionales bacterium]MBD3356004.1 DUF1795 domain-containing protein [Chitinivibrionales bacterium]